MEYQRQGLQQWKRRKTLLEFQGKTRPVESLHCILGQWPGQWRLSTSEFWSVIRILIWHQLSYMYSFCCVISLFICFFYVRFDDVFYDESAGGDDNDDNLNISLIALSQDDITTRWKFANKDFISPTYGLDTLVIENSHDTCSNEFNSDSTHSNTHFGTPNTFCTVLELIHDSLVGSPTYWMFSEDGLTGDDVTLFKSIADPIIAGVADRLASQDGKVLDE